MSVWRLYEARADRIIDRINRNCGGRVCPSRYILLYDKYQLVILALKSFGISPKGVFFIFVASNNKRLAIGDTAFMDNEHEIRY